MAPERVSADEAAALLLHWLELRGATALLNGDGYLDIDLDGIENFGSMTPELTSLAIFSLREELRTLLWARMQVRH